MTTGQIMLFVPAAVVVVTVACGAVYQLSLACVYLFLRKKRTWREIPTHSFVILIPAHDESLGLKSALENCLAVDYPRELFSVIVIADNCTDDTAQIARDCGVTCYERFDAEKRGKGEALEWAIPQVLADGHADAVLILDADCFLEPAALRACDFELERGCRVIQIAYLASNVDDSFRDYTMALARFIENQLFYWPKSRLGLSVAMLGSGMVLHRDVFARCPWRAGGLTEDFDYGLDLVRSGIKQVFVGDVGLISQFPVDTKQLETQRSRWTSGVLQGICKNFGLLLWQGIRKGNIVAVDAAVSMLFVSRPLVLCQVFLAGFVALLGWVVFPMSCARLILSIWLATLAMYFGYFLFGVLAMGLTRQRAKFLLFTPVFVLKYTLLTAKSVLFNRPKEWQRTPRHAPKTPGGS